MNLNSGETNNTAGQFAMIIIIICFRCHGPQMCDEGFFFRWLSIKKEGKSFSRRRETQDMRSFYSMRYLCTTISYIRVER